MTTIPDRDALHSVGVTQHRERPVIAFRCDRYTYLCHLTGPRMAEQQALTLTEIAHDLANEYGIDPIADPIARPITPPARHADRVHLDGPVDDWHAGWLNDDETPALTLDVDGVSLTLTLPATTDGLASIVSDLLSAAVLLDTEWSEDWTDELDEDWTDELDEDWTDELGLTDELDLDVQPEPIEWWE